jgi:Family of unknown function (DUF6130)
MKNVVIRTINSTLVLAVLVLGLGGLVSGQYGSNTNSQTGTRGRGTATLTARLVDPEKKAQQKAATVAVKVTGVRIIDPAIVKERPRAGQGHLHYQVDDGPVIATTAMKLSFHGLTSGPHKIVVTLAGNDHNPLGPEETLNVTIP